MEEDDKEYMFRWGLPLKGLYSVALKFYKEKEGSAIQFSYEEKLRLIAFTRQVSYGKYNEDSLPPLGVLDVIGRDRRMAWQALGDMSERDAMAGFISLIDKRCLHFNAFVQAKKAEIEEQNRIQNEKKKKEVELQHVMKLQEAEKMSKEINNPEADTAKRRLQEALNIQTFHQFKNYAEQQFPGNTEEQAVLITQLQDQHYHQYMLQLQQQPVLQSSGKDSAQNKVSNEELNIENNKLKSMINTEKITQLITGEHSDSEENDGILMYPASMWTRKDIQEFKNDIKREGYETIIKVGHGEMLTIRVPTRESGTCLFWEFATDNYDIAFGVYFEWEKSITEDVSVHISDSEEDSDELEEEQDNSDGDAVERGMRIASSRRLKPPITVIIPVYRRNCHQEVYTGSHSYPGEGVYLLKFDNSYSMLRSKTLYYRIYYSNQPL